MEPNDAAFQSGQPPPPRDRTLPYRLAVHYAPWISTGYTVTSLDKNSGSYPPAIGYSATIEVFDAATGRLPQTLPLRAEQTADSSKGPANPYLRAEVRDFLANLDPGYAKPASG